MREVEGEAPDRGSHAVESVAAWFDRIADPGHQGEVRLAEVAIATRTWGAPGRAPIILVHGGAAHARWWDHIGPVLARDREVTALDLSGHGDSSWRPVYGLDTWADEISATAAALQSTSMPIVIGHSMGGLVVTRYAQRHGHEVEAAVVIDTFLAGASASPPRAATAPALRGYPSREEILRRFRLVPDAPAHPRIRDYVARCSVGWADGAWRWKFDPQILATELRGQLTAAPACCPIVAIRGEHGVMPPESLERLRELLQGDVLVETIPEAGHHVMLDRPRELARLLGEVAARVDRGGF